jgi:hypothetical protein
MQPWARRQVRTAPMTGGSPMPGTGIASANENINGFNDIAAGSGGTATANSADGPQ